ncbi:hypothetical protein RFI_08758 [Reticulomyxa filosa]|uniref:Uncharacterized protein n=1 Tax=Reticulomyxa filosa TaxID=46433 RepID=X6NR60_RETFI|nr:hypothetical protein RFI_08758 [Reticulomyxa filosa]|eukprot:ETO28373.1 hypothetical protein RFI_08758 [Reticulomyxa filosa]
MLSNGKWRDYCILFDYQHRTIMLFNENKLKIKPLQVGNPNKSSLEFNVHIQWYNDFNDVNNTCTKWACLILNHTWHFRTMDTIDRDDLSNCVSVNEKMFLSIINYLLIVELTHKEPLNPYSITFKQGIQYLKNKLQIRSHFIDGKDELILFECDVDKCKPAISSKVNDSDVLLHDIYKHLPHYPIIQVYWEIKQYFMVPYKRTVGIERDNLPKSADLDIEFIPSNQKPKFNPLLYECDLHKLKVIQDAVNIKVIRSNNLEKLFHEAIKNDYLHDLVTRKSTNKKEEKQWHDNIKQQINYNEKDENSELILNDKILTILNELKILYHDDIHKQMGYPLQLFHICAILMYCGKSCNVQFSYDQIQFRHHLWPYLDFYLWEAIRILHKHERREESEMELYCGLKNVRFENIEKEIKSGFFISHVSTSDDIEVAQMYRSDQGCILHFHPSMRRALNIPSCDVSWISPFKHEREILFARSYIHFAKDEKIHKKEFAWNAKVESEDEYTQMILLTWVQYDQYIRQTMQISATWSHSIDLNLIYVALSCFHGDIDKTIESLFEFEQWKFQDNNEQKYKEKMNKYLERRCCNHHINLFCMFLFKEDQGVNTIKFAISYTVNNGLPFVKKDKETLIKTKMY